MDRERLEKETERGRDTETDSDGEKEGMCPVVVLKQVCDWDNLHSRPHRKVLDQTQSHHQALN
jgi:hypothetical protein